MYIGKRLTSRSSITCGWATRVKIAISLSIICSFPWHFDLSIILRAKSDLVFLLRHFRTTAKLPSPMISPTLYFNEISFGGIKWSTGSSLLTLAKALSTAVLLPFPLWLLQFVPVVIEEPFRGLSRVFEDAEVFLFLLAGCRLDKNFLRLVLGLALDENFSYLASSSGLFRIDWTFLQYKMEKQLCITGLTFVDWMTNYCKHSGSSSVRKDWFILRAPGMYGQNVVQKVRPQYTNATMIFCYQKFSALLWEKNCSSDREKLLKFEGSTLQSRILRLSSLTMNLLSKIVWFG